MSILGIDISHHQGAVDFEAVANDGMRFCIVKATEGVNYTDSRFRDNWRKLVGLGHERLYRGAYHFARPDSGGGAADGAAEAKDFCSALRSVGGYGEGALPPALDFEKYSKSDDKDNVPWIHAFVDTVETELGRSPMIYTGKNIWRYEVGNSDAFTGLPLWLVHYSGASSPSSALAALPWSDFTFWQYSGGRSYAHHPPVDGIPGSGIVDVNRFDGSEAALARLAQVGGPCPILNRARPA